MRRWGLSGQDNFCAGDESEQLEPFRLLSGICDVRQIDVREQFANPVLGGWMYRKQIAIVGALLGSSFAGAQSICPPVAASASNETKTSSPAPAPDCCVLPALTPVRIEISAHLNSALSKIGDHFAIRLAAPIDLGGGFEIPAGVEGVGEVVHAAKSGFGGRAGELLLAARYLDYRGARIPLRSLTFAPELGKSREGTAMGVAIAGGLVGGVAAMFISGGEVNIPPGTVVYAKTAAAVNFAGLSNNEEQH